MPDPLDVLRIPLTPLAPDPTFSARLRMQVERALTEGAAMTTTPEAADRPTARGPSPRPAHISYVSLWVPDAERAARFFAAVLGWRYAPVTEPRSRQVEGLRPQHGMWGGEAHNTLMLCFGVDAIGAAVERVRSGGGQAGEPYQEPYGVLAECVDDQGMRFALSESPPAAPDSPPTPSASTGHGSLSYITVEVVDSARFRAFFGDVLGWRFRPGRAKDGWGVEDVEPMVGVQGGHRRDTCLPMYQVDDIDSAVDRIRAAGGTATDPQRQPYGITAECTDDQGTRFYLSQR